MNRKGGEARRNGLSAFSLSSPYMPSKLARLEGKPQAGASCLKNTNCSANLKYCWNNQFPSRFRWFHLKREPSLKTCQSLHVLVKPTFFAPALAEFQASCRAAVSPECWVSLYSFLRDVWRCLQKVSLASSPEPWEFLVFVAQGF